jgi:heme-degrading monooxygenase HmoA
MYVNIFRSRKRADFDAAAYDADAERMEALARTQKGFISFRSYSADDGEKLSMSEWETEEDARAWQRNAEHVAVQGKGRSDYYETYTVYSCNEPQVRSFNRGGAR